MSTLGETHPRALGIFFSYASESHHFVRKFLSDTRFREILRARIWNYRNTPLQVGGLGSGLSKRLRECEVFVAFVSGDYGRGETTRSEFDEAIRMVTADPPAGRTRHLVVIVLDADGAAWWDDRKATITGWLRDPVHADFVGDHGTGPRDVGSIVGWIDDLAKQLKEFIAEEEQARNAGSSSSQPA